MRSLPPFRLTLGLAPVLFLPFLAAAQTIPAFPGAEGYGGYAKGGRGGDVYVVTNLNASGTGSFAEGIATLPAAGRTIVSPSADTFTSMACGSHHRR